MCGKTRTVLKRSLTNAGVEVMRNSPLSRTGAHLSDRILVCVDVGSCSYWIAGLCRMFNQNQAGSQEPSTCSSSGPHAICRTDAAANRAHWMESRTPWGIRCRKVPRLLLLSRGFSAGTPAALLRRANCVPTCHSKQPGSTLEQRAVPKRNGLGGYVISTALPGHLIGLPAAFQAAFFLGMVAVTAASDADRARVEHARSVP
jgi:hypothetical protein